MKRLPYPRTDRPRVIVTTDPELDDLNSVLRLLLHANELDLRGLVTSASACHYRGCPERGVHPYRWPDPAAPDHIGQAIAAYERVEETLRVHDCRYPTAAYLRSIWRQGNVDEVGDMRASTPGSLLITRELFTTAETSDDADPLTEDGARPLFISAWGGFNTIARALADVDTTLASMGESALTAGRRRIAQRVVLTAFGEQDETYRSYIARVWPDVEIRQVATLTWGYTARLTVLPEDRVLLEPEWMSAHVSQLGPMGAAYRVWGDGRQMAQGWDSEDYFGLRGLVPGCEEDLRDRGYLVFTPVQKAGAWISEGDSSNLALLVDNGLRSWEDPTFGGWAGRQELEGGTSNVYSAGMVLTGPPEAGRLPQARVKDAVPGSDGREAPPEYAVSRWWRAIQHELAGRLAWSLASRYADANHPPVIEVEGGLAREVVPGQVVELVARAQDPDGDAVRLQWWCYQEAGTCPEPVEVAWDQQGKDAVARVRVPERAVPGQTVHLIVQGEDLVPEGRISFVRYQRVILTVQPMGTGRRPAA